MSHLLMLTTMLTGSENFINVPLSHVTLTLALYVNLVHGSPQVGLIQISTDYGRK